MEYTLTVTFICTNGEKSSLSISGVKKDISSEEVNTLMDTLITQNIFATKNGDLVKKSGAYLTGKQVSQFEIA